MTYFIRHSDLVILSSLVIRHLPFVRYRQFGHAPPFGP